MKPLKPQKIHYPKKYCQIIIISFITTNNIFSLFLQTQKWKEVDPKLKTMLSVGGYTFGSKIFSQMVRTEERREAFIKQSIIYLKKWGMRHFMCHCICKSDHYILFWNEFWKQILKQK